MRTSAIADEALDSRSLAALAAARNVSTDALRLLMRGTEIIMLSLGQALGNWRETRDPVSGAFAEHCQAEVKCQELREALAILSARLRRVPPSQRKRYTPEERFQIVVFMRKFSLTLEEAAELFLLDAGTIGRWLREATREPDKGTVGSLLKATPPVRTTSDVTQQLVALLDSVGVGNKTMAQMLTRAGRKIGRETVRRIRKNRTLTPPPPEPQ